MAKPTESWMEEKLLTCVAKIGLQPANSMIEKKAQNKKVGTQSENLEVSMGTEPYEETHNKERDLTTKNKKQKMKKSLSILHYTQAPD